MQLPLIGKVTKPSPWLMGLLATGIVGVGLTSVVLIRASQPQFNLAELTVTAAAKDITVRIAASGSVVPVQVVNLSPKTSGRLTDLYVEQGDTVTKGQVIARMDNADVEPQVAQARAAVVQAQAKLAEWQAGSRREEIGQAQAAVDRAMATGTQVATTVTQAEADVQQAQSRVDLAQERVKRNQSLADQGAIARDRLDEVLNEARVAESSLRGAQAKLNNAKANLSNAQAGVQEARQRLQLLRAGTRPEQIAQAEAQVAEAQARLQAVLVQQKDTVIRAPFAGVVTQRYADPGDFVTPTTSASATASATSTSIVALASGLEILAKVPEADIGRVHLGQEVEIVADAYPDQVFKGKVRLIAPEAVVEQNVTSFQVRIALTTGRNQLRSGMNTDLQFLGTRLNNALVVPSVAIVTQRGQAGVFVPSQSDRPKFQPVTIGANIGNEIQILKGISAGQRVFVELPAGKKLEDFIKTEAQQ
jgi:HlyD family secretion protein